jgi:hypothetical protein
VVAEEERVSAVAAADRAGRVRASPVARPSASVTARRFDLTDTSWLLVIEAAATHAIID